MAYSTLNKELGDLIAEHRENTATPLLLAVYFRSRQYPDEDCVLEVLDHFGFNQVADDRRIFQMTFGRSAEFLIPDTARVRLLLTNPVELRRAIRSHWSEIADVQMAIGDGDYNILYQDQDKGAESWRALANVPHNELVA